MIHARESISEFFKANIGSLAHITDPDMRFEVRSNSQPPEFSNVLNLYFFDDDQLMKTDPAKRSLMASLELLIQIEPIEPLKAERLALEAIAKINKFLQVQVTDKYIYTSGSPVYSGSKITWRDSYPLSWKPVSTVDERYVSWSSMITFNYWEEKLASV